MSLVNSQYTYFDLKGADERTFKTEVDRLAKEADDSRSGSQPAKRQRLSQDSSGSSQNGSVALPDWDGVSGTIIKLTLEDFLCHTFLEVDLNAKINFIVGRNGSGKSAILTALVVALGGTASTTGRGTSLKDFIRNGAASARITCVVNNSGHLQFKPHEYGGRIIIVRTIQQSGGGVVLKSERGRKISSTMDELRNMALTLGIQVDNPISVLDQNTARQFLNQSSPQKKFELFMKATNLEALQRLYAEITRDTNKINQEILSKENQLEENSTEVKEAKRRYDILQNLERDRERKEELQHEYLWAIARDDEKAVEKAVNKYAKVKGEMERLTQMMAGGGAEEAILQQIDAAEKDIEVLDSQESEKDSEVKTLKQEAQGISMRNRQLMQEKQRIVQQIAEEEENIGAYKSEIESQQQRMLPDHIEQRRKQREQVQALQRRLQEKYVEQGNNEKELETLRNAVNGCNENIRSLNMNQRSLEDQQRQARREIESLQRQDSNLAVFGHYMQELDREIKKAAQNGQFQKKPVGPLGAYVKVKEARWTLAVEAVLGGRLRTFAVDNARDERELQNIIKRVCRGQAKPSVICTKFHNRVHDTSRTKAQSNQYSTVLDMIEVSDPVAANMLMELCSIETTLLIPTDNECQDNLADERYVPRNCQKAYTVKGDLYFPAPSFRTYAGSGRSARILQASREDVIRETQERLQELGQTMQAEQQQLADQRKQEAELKKKMQLLYSEKKTLQGNIAELNDALEQLKDQEQPDLNTVSTLRKELEEKEELVRIKKMALEEFPAKLEEVTQKIAEINAQLKKIAKEISEIRSQREPHRRKINKCREELRELHTTQSQIKRNMENLKKQEVDLIKEKEEFETRCQESKEEAVKFEAHLQNEYAEKGKTLQSLSNTQRPSARVEQELCTLKKKLDSVEKALGDNHANISAEYHEKLQTYTSTRDYIACLKKNAAYLSRALKIRKSLYHTQKELMVAVVCHQFTRVLRFRNHVGSLKFNAEAGTLHIESGPMDGVDRAGLGTSSLSGGERSYTTMAFVIALWNVTELPFYFMDEFDVFMDCLNRKTVLSLMLRFAKQKNLFQFGFLTPLDTAVIKADEDVTIFKLDDPRK